jgi:two-component system phosphate regulon response regulator PhoB
LPDLVVLDLMLPVLNGLEVCRQLRAGQSTRSIPILMLTAKAEETDQVVGFSMGADDYVTKPFSVKVLVQRLKALQRRREAESNDGNIIEHAGLRIDRVRHQAYVDNPEIDLTPTEFRLLECLLRQPGRAFGRSELMDAAIGEGAIVLERTIDVHIKSLRRKLGDAGELIDTVRGVGYRLRESKS